MVGASDLTGNVIPAWYSYYSPNGAYIAGQIGTPFVLYTVVFVNRFLEYVVPGKH